MNYKDRFRFIMNPNATRTKQICFLVIDVLQQFRKEDVVVTLAILWLMVCDRYKLKTWEVLDTAQAIINDAFTTDFNDQDQLKALKEYIKNELK